MSNLILGRQGPPALKTPPVLEIPVGAEPVRWNGWLLGADSVPWAGKNRDSLEEWVDADRLGAGLQVRSRRPGDVFHPLGAAGGKKLKEFLRSRRIHPGCRDALPLIVSGAEIVWVVGERIAHGCRVTPRTHNTLRLYARREGEVG